MSTVNPFDLLGDNDNDDPSLLITSQEMKGASKKPTDKQPPSQAKLPAKPLPPAQAVRDSKAEAGPGRVGARGGGRGFGRGRGPGFSREFNNNGAQQTNGVPGGYGGNEDGEVGKAERGRGGYGGDHTPYRGGRRGGFNNGENGDLDRPRRQFERRSGTGRGNEFKRDGAGRGNWGAPIDEGAVQESEEVVGENGKVTSPEKPSEEENNAAVNKDNAVNEPEQKEPENKEMTLSEYEKVLEEKRKALQALKNEERKVNLDKDFESMLQLSDKKANDDVFIKLGSEKDAARRKEIAEKEERIKKSVSINEFLKPVDGGRYYSPRGRGRGQGRGGFGGGISSNSTNSIAAPSIEDQNQFPTLAAK
ncbi:hypothetical protein AMTRI_Chr13g82910 [Amborella trichopoda]|uniref:Hyaluronan/mRNA-binding protein domain-containing protein n=1 Tax=Amborella trichopoda TaxID=13333 RepID=W1NZY8_AMBTC|nr:RGG repeats nuclear RNA binding protein A [Amborella trichopoda]ERN00255.1 hypothetical protein AMTR_s00111p00140620 [Amborella trichopoda]|eukprot:XP_006837401.1 RGG repeats nuclear RNA binding protein A [Amborella trichopoda]